MAIGGNTYEWRTELYCTQDKSFWPWRGRHILAQYDDDTVVVYQAFNPEIADFAVKNQRFGGDHFSYDRMSWIKTNFLWMMYRCGWARKKNQDRVLAVRLTRTGFNEILSNAFNSKLLKSKEHGTILVRLQWDPDHAPSGERVYRKAIQLGLKGKILRKYGNDWIVQISDVTDFVREQGQKIFKKNTKKYVKSGEAGLMTARERVYPVTDPDLLHRLELDPYEGKHSCPVVERDDVVKTSGDDVYSTEQHRTIHADGEQPDNDLDRTPSAEDEHLLDNVVGRAHLPEDEHLPDNDLDRTLVVDDEQSLDHDRDTSTNPATDSHIPLGDRDMTGSAADDLSWDSLYPD